MLPVALASGIRPCTGAILVLLFTLSQGIFEIGVLATFVMSFGTFLVVALIGLGVIYARRAASRAGGRHERLANLAQRAVSLVGGLFVALFGVAFCLEWLDKLGFKWTL
jgi:ABC-type nickel/cobalt efflux system permease component RcnA